MPVNSISKMNVFVELTEAYDRKPIKIKEIIIKTLVSMRTFWCFGHSVKNTIDNNRFQF